MKLLIILSILLSLSQIVFAQSTVNASGGTQTIAGDTYSYSIGEMSMISTNSNGSITVTHGVLQPMTQTPDAVNDFKEANISLNAYPNPTSQLVHIDLETPFGASTNLVLLSMHGKKVYQQQQNVIKGKNQLEINVEQYASGTYLLQIHVNNKNKNYNQSLQIVKH